MSVKLIWATPDAEKHILYMARVSSPHQDSNDTRLLSYLLKHKHWSPFEMVGMCLEIITTRDISAQMIRHRSFSFQEFSQRYAEATEIISAKPRRQDLKNRQNSTDDLPEDVKQWWDIKYGDVTRYAQYIYNQALEKGIAKECARKILPMNTETKLYMNGTLRSWIHYFQLRCSKDTQLEHREVALDAKKIFSEQFPIIFEALEKNDLV